MPTGRWSGSGGRAISRGPPSGRTTGAGGRPAGAAGGPPEHPLRPEAARRLRAGLPRLRPRLGSGADDLGLAFAQQVEADELRWRGGGGIVEMLDGDVGGLVEAVAGMQGARRLASDLEDDVAGDDVADHRDRMLV